MIKINGRNQVDFEFLYVFSIKPPHRAAQSAQCLLGALNDYNGISGITGQAIEVETPELKMSGRALSQTEVLEVIGFWNMPDGDKQMRCHIPHHGIATFHNGSFDWFAAICFMCLNICIEGPSASLKHRIIPEDQGGLSADPAFTRYLDSLHPKIA